MRLTARSVARAALALAAAVIAPTPVRALQVETPQLIAPVPFTVGEELNYRATFAGLHAGSAQMRVDGIDTVRGRPAYHLVFTIDGGVPGYRLKDRYESWLDVETLSSLRHTQQISEGRYKRNTTYEIFPERREYQKNSEPILPTVANPLDDGSFVYAVRIAGISIGETRSDDRYFKPESNPVVLTGLTLDTLGVGAGRFVTTVVRPSIKGKGLFNEKTNARIWFSADADRYPVQVQTRIGAFPVTLKLESVKRGSLSVAEGKATETKHTARPR